MAAGQLLTEQGLTGRLREVGQIRHAYSHFRLEVTVFQGVVDGVKAIDQVAEGEPSVWLPLAELADLALHGAHKKVLALLASGG